MAQEPLLVKLGDKICMLGITRRILAAVRVVTWPEIPEGATPDTGVTISLEPGPDPSAGIDIFKPRI
ncbi:hypothetical protein GCM10012280_09250 [Wenjunlia tyrosinilytica]|uniref:Uncharacterized protein n=1 Tax=Wenjunlia tyrosinilytica TaxID=1544741 RepID=A0A917ZIM2_9ACTN|nr:hypothetical protein GCM10012280_09250 [Wenjunlia tyrosinilytica]